VNTLFAGGGIAAVCLHDRRSFPAEVIEDACTAHPITPDRAWLRFTRTDVPAGLRVSGEADLTNSGAFRALLAPLGGLGFDITIDATGLRFADVEAASALAGAAAARSGLSTTIWCAEPLARLLGRLGATGVATVSVRVGSYG
jgi:hypothetical protein